MKRVSEYTKMKVLAAVEMAEGKTIRERIRQATTLDFHDEEGLCHRFTWRTIETWRTRYQKHGRTVVAPRDRSDKGKTRKIEPEQVLEAIEQARAFLRPGFKLSELYRLCIERGLLIRDQIAPNTFRRIVKAHEMLKPEVEVTDKRRLAFSKAHANEIFLREDSRKVLADNTFRFAAIRWEAPRDLRHREIQLRHHVDERGKPAAPLIVYYQNQRQGQATPVDFLANDRPSPSSTTPTCSTSSTCANSGCYWRSFPKTTTSSFSARPRSSPASS